jgi:hypothetical protein
MQRKKAVSARVSSGSRAAHPGPDGFTAFAGDSILPSVFPGSRWLEGFSRMSFCVHCGYIPKIFLPACGETNKNPYICMEINGINHFRKESLNK